MLAPQRKSLRGKIKNGLFYKHINCIIKVNKLNADTLHGEVVFSDFGNYKIGQYLTIHHSDSDDYFFINEDVCILEYKKSRVKRAKDVIKRANAQIENAQATINKYPEFAI